MEVWEKIPFQIGILIVYVKMEIQDMLEEAEKCYDNAIANYLTGKKLYSLVCFSVAKAYYERLEDLERSDECDIEVVNLVKELGLNSYKDYEEWIKYGDLIADQYVIYLDARDRLKGREERIEPSLEEVIRTLSSQ